jgi:hypothetical protein
MDEQRVAYARMMELGLPPAYGEEVEDKHEPERTEVVVLGHVERAVRDAFEKRFSGQHLAYEVARQLVWLEQDIMANVKDELLSRAYPPDARED